MEDLSYYKFNKEENNLLDKFFVDKGIKKNIILFLTHYLNDYDYCIDEISRDKDKNNYSDEDISDLKALFKRVALSKSKKDKISEISMASIEGLINASETVAASISTTSNPWSGNTISVLSMIGPDKDNKSKLVYTSIGIEGEFDFTDIVNVENEGEVDSFLNELKESGFYPLLDIIKSKYKKTSFYIPKVFTFTNNEKKEKFSKISKIYVDAPTDSFAFDNINSKFFMTVEEIEFHCSNTIDANTDFGKFISLKKVTGQFNFSNVLYTLADTDLLDSPDAPDLYLYNSSEIDFFAKIDTIVDNLKKLPEASGICGLYVILRMDKNPRRLYIGGCSSKLFNKKIANTSSTANVNGLEYYFNKNTSLSKVDTPRYFVKINDNNIDVDSNTEYNKFPEVIGKVICEKLKKECSVYFDDFVPLAIVEI